MFWEIKKKKKQQKKKLIAKNMKKYLHNRNGQYYIANKCHQFSNLEVIYIAEYTKVIHWLKIEQKPSGTRLAFCFILKPKITFFHLLLFVFFGWTRRLLSLVVTSLSFVVTCCTTRFHSLSLDPPLISIFMNDLPMLWCECFSQVFIIKIKKGFSIELSESIPIVPSISLLLLIIFPVNLNGLEMN